MKDENGGRDLKPRVRNFALAIVRFYCKLPKTTEAQVLAKQLLRSGTSVGAHYYEAQRAKSDADFISKIEGALQEAEESGYWLDLLQGADICSSQTTRPLQDEATQLIAIFVSIVRRVKQRVAETKSPARTTPHPP